MKEVKHDNDIKYRECELIEDQIKRTAISGTEIYHTYVSMQQRIFGV